MLDFFIALADISGWLLKIYLWIHIAAFFIGWIQADSRNAMVALINRITIPTWRGMERRLPTRLSSWAPYFVLILIIFAEIVVPGLIRSLGGVLNGNLGLGVGLKNIVFYLLFGASYIFSHIAWFIVLLSIICFIFSLVGSPLNNVFVRSVVFLMDPLTEPLRRILPRSRIDLSLLALAAIAFFLKSASDSLSMYIKSGIII